MTSLSIQSTVDDALGQLGKMRSVGTMSEVVFDTATCALVYRWHAKVSAVIGRAAPTIERFFPPTSRNDACEYLQERMERSAEYLDHLLALRKDIALNTRMEIPAGHPDVHIALQEMQREFQKKLRTIMSLNESKRFWNEMCMLPLLIHFQRVAYDQSDSPLSWEVADMRELLDCSTVRKQVTVVPSNPEGIDDQRCMRLARSSIKMLSRESLLSQIIHALTVAEYMEKSLE